VRAALAIAVALLAATPAAASETIARSALTSGPVLAGGSVLWADAPSGRPRVLSRGAGRSPVVLRSWPRATTKDTGRTVAALAGSPTSTVAVVETCTFRLDGDAGFVSCAERAFGGAAGTFAPFGWPLPRRSRTGCPGPRTAVSVAAGTGLTAVAYTPACQGIALAAARRSRIVVHRGSARQTIASAGASHLRIAGHYLAYLEGRRLSQRTAVVLYDLRSRQQVRRYEMPKGTAYLEALDVQANGTLAFVRSESDGRACVAVLRRRAERERDLACHVDVPYDVAIAAGRVLFLQVTPRGTRLVLRSPGGRRVLDRIPRTRSFGGFDLAPDRAVWAVGAPGGVQRIVLRQL